MLAAVALYATVAYLSVQRAREFGIDPAGSGLERESADCIVIREGVLLVDQALQSG